MAKDPFPLTLQTLIVVCQLQPSPLLEKKQTSQSSFISERNHHTSCSLLVENLNIFLLAHRYNPQSPMRSEDGDLPF